MPIIKEIIKFENQDVNLKINLGVGNNISGYQQEIDELTENTKVELINPIIDNEVRRFQFKSSTNTPTNIQFYFGTTHVSDFGSTGANFSDFQISNHTLKIRNSFFTMDFYDSFDSYTQRRIFTIYQTQIFNGETTTTGFGNSGEPIPKYKIKRSNQFYSWYVPKTFIDQNIATGTTAATGYVKFSFYTARYGKIRLFYNYDNRSLETPEKMYFKVKLNLINMTWEFDANGGNKKAYQVPITNMYAKKVNDAVENFDNKQQDYPEGNTFVDDADYEIL